jgi:hypothetical protein
MAIGKPNWLGNSGVAPPSTPASKPAPKAAESGKSSPAEDLARANMAPIKVRGAAPKAPAAPRAEPASNGDLKEIAKAVLAAARSTRA